MAEQDIAMNQFQVITNVEYIYGEKSDSSQGKIHKSNLLSTLVVKKSELCDCNEIKSSSIIVGNKWSNAPYVTIAILETIAYSSDWVIQRYTVPGSPLRLYVRSFYNGSTWSNWVPITLT